MALEEELTGLAEESDAGAGEKAGVREGPWGNPDFSQASVFPWVLSVVLTVRRAGMQKACGAACGQVSARFRQRPPLLAVPLCKACPAPSPLPPGLLRPPRPRCDIPGKFVQEPRLSWADGVWRGQVQGRRGTGMGEAGWRRAQAPPEGEGLFGNTRRWAARSHWEDVFPRTGQACDVLSGFQGGGWRRPWLQPGGV